MIKWPKSSQRENIALKNMTMFWQLPSKSLTVDFSWLYREKECLSIKNSISSRNAFMEFGEGKVQIIFKMEGEQNNPSISNNEEKWEKK